MASSEDPPRKKYATDSSINFQLCLLCQGEKFTKIEGVYQLEHLRLPELESLLNCINNRALYQNLEYVRLQQQLSGVSGEELNNNTQAAH